MNQTLLTVAIDTLRQALQFNGPLSVLIADSNDVVVEADDCANVFGQASLLGQSLEQLLQSKSDIEFETLSLAPEASRLALVRRRSEPEHEDESLLRTQFQSHAESLASIGCFIWDIQTNRIQWSDGLYRIYGLDPDTFNATLEAFVELVLPEDRDAVQAAVRTAIENCGKFESVERIRHASGEVRSLESRGQVLTDSNGKPVRLVGVCRDVTQRTKFHELQTWQIEGLKILAEFAETTLTQKDLNDWVPLVRKLANHLQCDAFSIYGYVDNELQLELTDGFDDDTVQLIRSLKTEDLICGTCAESREFLYVSSECRNQHPKGNPLWNQGVQCFVGVPLMLDDRLLGVMSLTSTTKTGLVSDELDFVRTVGRMVSAWKAQTYLENETRLAEERNSVILNHAQMMTFEADPETFDFKFLSGPCRSISGYSRDEWTAPGFWRDHMRDGDKPAISTFDDSDETIHQFECRMIHAQGHEIWIQVYAEIVHAENGRATKVLRGVLWDVTRRRQLESKLHDSQKMEVVGRLASGVAHDFNNLLTVINSYAEMLSLDIDHSQVKESATGIRDAATRASRLTGQLLMFGRDSVQDAKVVSLNEVIQETMSLLDRLVGPDIRFQLHLASGMPGVNADRGHLDQVLFNLCVNARDAMPYGGTIRIESEVFTVVETEGDLEPGEYVRLSVADEGVGMSAETRSRAMEPFFTTKQRGKGTGLGLSVVYGVAKQCGGTIQIESSVGQGTTVTIFFPAATNAPAAKLDSTERMQRGSEVILLVEDEDAVRRSTTDILEYYGYKVLQASTAQEAIEQAECVDGQFALLLTDVVMPTTGGPELVDQMLSRFPETKVLFMSGYSDIDTDSGNEPHGLERPCLQKPFSADLLVRTIRSTIDS